MEPIEFTSNHHTMVGPFSGIYKSVLDFAKQAHGEQKRKYTGDPYIYHPMNIFYTVAEFSNDFPTLSAALLHDVLEDTPVTREELRSFLSKEMHPPLAVQVTMGYVEWLTDKYTKTQYPHLNRRSRKEKEALRLADAPEGAQTIKYADIIDNTASIAAHDPDFCQTYLPECYHLLELMTKGNKILRIAAISSVEDAMKSLGIK